MSDIKPLQLPDDVRDAMWQFFYKTSIPRLIAQQKEKERAELGASKSNLAEEDEE